MILTSILIRTDIRSYVPPVGIGERMRGVAVSRVLASRNPKAKAGDLVNATCGWTEVAVVGPQAFEVVPLPAGARPIDAVGALGMTGLTAYFGMMRIGDPKPGETVVVSGAAGATGSIAGQIAKIRGARVVGIAGGADKCRWLREELGYDDAVDYKAPDFRQRLRAATPDHVNVYFDNVGGEVLDAVLMRAAKGARFVMCGSISGYNDLGKGKDKDAANAPPRRGIQNLYNVVTQRIRMEGFIVFDYAAEYAAAREEIGAWIADGRLKRKETVVKGGLQEAEKSISLLFEGKNTGKLLVEVKPYEEAARL